MSMPDWRAILAAGDDNQEFVRLNEFEDVATSFEILASLAPLVGAHPNYWKWILIVAHNALQSALVCALSGSDRTGALTVESARKWHKWYSSRDDSEPPSNANRIASFSELILRARDPHFLSAQGGCALKISPAEMLDLEKVDEFRHELIHFKSVSWSIEKAGLSRMIDTTIKYSLQLIEQPHVRHYFASKLDDRITSAVSEVRKAFADS